MPSASSKEQTRAWLDADRAHQWHPFTQMRDWCAPGHEPPVIVSGHGAVLRDSLGNEYIDGNSSIWTNLHGHNHPKINAAIAAQLGEFAHCSFLGCTHPPAIELGRELVGLFPPGTLTRVFFSDDGATAIEAALRMARQYWQLLGEGQRRRFLAFENAYHGDTVGAANLGGIPMIHGRLAPADDVIRVADVDALDALTADEIEHPGRGGDRAVDPGRGGDASLAAGHVEEIARVVRSSRRVAHCRRGDDRVRPHRHDVRV